MLRTQDRSQRVLPLESRDQNSHAIHHSYDSAIVSRSAELVAPWPSREAPARRGGACGRGLPASRGAAHWLWAASPTRPPQHQGSVGLVVWATPYSMSVQAAGPPPSSARVRLVPLQDTPPRLRLEILTASQVEVVLGITYAAVIAAAAIALLERQAYVYDDVSISALPSWDSGCADGPSPHTACLGDNATWWANGWEFINATATPLDLSVNYTNRFFKLHANLSTRSFGPPSPSITRAGSIVQR
jgi:hypothetical protein